MGFIEIASGIGKFFSKDHIYHLNERDRDVISWRRISRTFASTGAQRLKIMEKGDSLSFEDNQEILIKAAAEQGLTGTDVDRVNRKAARDSNFAGAILEEMDEMHRKAGVVSPTEKSAWYKMGILHQSLSRLAEGLGGGLKGPYISRLSDLGKLF